MAVAHQVRAQDVTLTPDGTLTLRPGVAEDRRMSVEDGEMRHGRKSRSLLIDGYKRHVLRDLDSGLIVAVGVTPANVPEASVTEAIGTDLAAQQRTLTELHIDRAYLASTAGATARGDVGHFLQSVAGASRAVFSKSAFHLDWERRELQCPGGVVMPFEPGGTVKFPASTCAGCALRERCTTSPAGGASAFIPMKPCWRSCVNASGHRMGARSCASVSRWSMPWPTLDIGKAAVPAIAACGRMCLTCGGVLLFITCMC